MRHMALLDLELPILVELVIDEDIVLARVIPVVVAALEEWLGNLIEIDLTPSDLF